MYNIQLQGLPGEIILQILWTLDRTTLVALTDVNKFWRETIQHFGKLQDKMRTDFENKLPTWKRHLLSKIDFSSTNELKIQSAKIFIDGVVENTTIDIYSLPQNRLEKLRRYSYSAHGKPLTPFLFFMKEKTPLTTMGKEVINTREKAYKRYKKLNKGTLRGLKYETSMHALLQHQVERFSYAQMKITRKPLWYLGDIDEMDESLRLVM